ncbi:Rho GTPase activating protein [Massospora cicadina]|nr:Rho GTPase activating protein [Massospora cicadina]
MSSPKSLNSVLESYESAPPPEPYRVVLEERNALRQQNQQLWRIIEKQRAIIHQLQLFKSGLSTRSRGTSDVQPQSSDFPQKVSLSVSLEHIALEKPTDSGMGLLACSDPHVAYSASFPSRLVSKPVGLAFDQEFSRAQTVNNILSERLPNTNSPEELIHEEPLTLTSSEGLALEPPTLHKAISESSLRRQDAPGTYSGSLNCGSLNEGDANLKVPRRSSLRGRPEAPKGFQGRSRAESPKRIPDLRKAISSEDKLIASVTSGAPDATGDHQPDFEFPTGKVQRSHSEHSMPTSPGLKTAEADGLPKSPTQNSIGSTKLTQPTATAIDKARWPQTVVDGADNLIRTDDSSHSTPNQASESGDEPPPKAVTRRRQLKLTPEETNFKPQPQEPTTNEKEKELENSIHSRSNSRNRKAALVGISSVPALDTVLAKCQSVDERVAYLRQEFSHLAMTPRQLASAEASGSGALFHLTLFGNLTKESRGEGELPPLPVELWQLEKSWSQLASLEAQLLGALSASHLALMPPLPAWPLSPLGQELQDFLSFVVQLPSDAVVVAGDPVGQFLATDLVVDAASASPQPRKPIYKSGNLLKRGKKLGKLKLRFFVASSPMLEYFESNEGAHLGSINLLGAQVVRSVVASLHSELYERYVYAITVMERKKANLIKHTFFIDNHADWDEWISVLEHFANNEQSDTDGKSGPRRMKSQDSVSSQPSASPTETDIYATALSHNDPKPKTTRYEFMGGKGLRKDSATEKETPKATVPPRKAFQWNTRMFSGRADAFQKRPTGQHKIFGVPLEQAIAQAPIKAGYQMPSVLHRCIEFLDNRKAFFEEGIYRLSGSAADIQHLKEKFDSEGDYNLLKSGTRYDVHTVAGLLKLYLREMPTYVLTQELQPEFLKVVDIQERYRRVNELGRLVCALPLPNYTLLRTLTAHLIRIIERSDVNKMTLRNIGIVFVPTLAVPAGTLERAPSVDAAPADAPPAAGKASSPELWNAPPSNRDHRNSAIYRDVVPPELPFGLRRVIDGWHYDRKAHLPKQPTLNEPISLAETQASGVEPDLKPS